MTIEFDGFAQKTFAPRRVRFLLTSLACLLGGVVLFWLITDVNKGGTAGLNLVFIVGGAGMCAVSLYSGAIFLKQLFAPTLAVSSTDIVALLFGREVDRWTLSSIKEGDWAMLTTTQGSGSLWSDVYHAMKAKGLCLRLNPVVIVFERYKAGLPECIKERMTAQGLAVSDTTGRSETSAPVATSDGDAKAAGGRIDRHSRWAALDDAALHTELTRLATYKPADLGLILAEATRRGITVPQGVSCWSCKAFLHVTDRNRGTRIKCPQCGTRQALPA